VEKKNVFSSSGVSRCFAEFGDDMEIRPIMRHIRYEIAQGNIPEEKADEELYNRCKEKLATIIDRQDSGEFKAKKPVFKTRKWHDEKAAEKAATEDASLKETVGDGGPDDDIPF